MNLPRNKEELYLFVFSKRNIHINYLIKILGNFHEAEEVLGDFYLNLISKKADKFDFSRAEKWEGWTYSCLYKSCLDYLKSKKEKQKRRECSSIHLEEFFSIQDEDELIKREEIKNLKRNLNQLEEPYQQMLIMYYYQNQSYREIANKLGIPIGTVKSRIYVAKKNLKEKIEV